MKTVKLFRTETGKQGTFGFFKLPCDLQLNTGEPPWKNNRPNVSCIPEGRYIVRRYASSRFGYVYRLCDTMTAPRAAILIHTGNLAGDIEMGLLSHTHGCILPGLYMGAYKNQKAVLGSRAALNKFIDAMGNNEFNLVVENLFGNRSKRKKV